MRWSVKRFADPWRPRLLPAFVIIGAQKAGTSALFRMLAQHPHVIAPDKKELHFFDDDAKYAKGIAYYKAQFPFAPLRGRKITFEATPAYLFVERCAERLHRHLPRARLIVVLRDPVKRAYSAWNMFRDLHGDPTYGHLHDPRPFSQAVEDELAGRPPLHSYDYLLRGEYAPQLKRYFDLFGRDRVRVIGYPALRDRPLDVVNAIFADLGLAPFNGTEPALSVRDNTRPYTEPIDPEVEQRLRTYFAPHLGELDALLGEHLDLAEGFRSSTIPGPKHDP